MTTYLSTKYEVHEFTQLSVVISWKSVSFKMALKPYSCLVDEVVFLL